MTKKIENAYIHWHDGKLLCRDVVLEKEENKGITMTKRLPVEKINGIWIYIPKIDGGEENETRVGTTI